MTKQEFSQSIEIMVNALPTPNVEKRVSALYEFYQNTPRAMIEKAAKEAAHDLDRFPTPRAFSEILAKHRKTGAKRDERADCSICDGYGRVTIGLEVYAGKCEHGDQYPAFKKAPTDHNQVFAILRFQEEQHDAFYGSGSWKERTSSLRRLAEKKCLPKGTWI
jgi:hypothetical protein